MRLVHISGITYFTQVHVAKMNYIIQSINQLYAQRMDLQTNNHAMFQQTTAQNKATYYYSVSW